MATKSSSKPKVVPVAPLPAGFTMDLTEREYGSSARKKYDKVPQDFHYVQLWYVERFGWCIPTLEISRRGARSRNYQWNGTPAQNLRTYAVTMDGQTVRIGMGPHVKQVLMFHPTNESMKVLQKYYDLFIKGSIRAHEIRDSRSSRSLGFFG